MAKIEIIHYTSDFKKSYEKLSKNLQRLIDRKDVIFRENPFHPSLETHKLKGPLKNFWSFSVNNSFRILFEFLNGNEVIFYDVGTHEIYR